MASSSNPTRTWPGLVALVAAAVLSLLVMVGSSPADARPPDGDGDRRRPVPSRGDDCGNLLLRRGRYTPLPVPRDAASDPRATVYNDINNRRELVGAYAEAGTTRDATGFYPLGALHQVLRDERGRLREIEVRGALETLAYSLNDRAHVVGQYIDGGAEPDDQGRLPAGTVHGFLWRHGRITTVDVPGAALTQPLAINNHGDIVGAYLDAVRNPDDPYAHYDEGRLRGFVLRDGRFTPIDFPGGDGTKVSGINDRGQMVGYYDDDDLGVSHGFLLRRGRFTELDPPGSLTTLPSSIDNRGRVVGGYLDPNGVNARGFQWDDGHYTTIVAPGDRTDTIALASNDRGEILIPADGTYYRLPEEACGRPTAPASAAAPSPMSATTPASPPDPMLRTQPSTR